MDTSVLLSVASIVGGGLSGVVAALIAAAHQAQRNRRRQDDALAASVGDVAYKMEDRIRQESQILHDRMSKLQDETYKELIHRMGKIEGELVGLHNVMRILQERYMGADRVHA